MNSKSFRMSKCMTAPNMLGSKKKAKKSLLCTVMAGVVACGGAASAATLDEVDLTQIPLDKPTLDYLHENNVTYSKDTNGDGVGDTDVIYPQSGYTLTGVDDKSLPNVITKYTFDSSANNLTEHYYQVGLKNTIYGEGENAKYFKWTQDSTNGNYVFEETTQDKAQITANYGSLLTGVRDDIIREYTGNYINQYSEYPGGAFRHGSMHKYNIIGNFINNYSDNIGGAIELHGYDGSYRTYITNLTGDFIGNHTTSRGGAIYFDNQDVSVQVNNIVGNYIGNYVNGNIVGGGAFYLRAGAGAVVAIFLDNIKSDFIGNYALGVDSASGGAISGYGKIENLEGDFIGNYAQSINGTAQGGFIYKDQGSVGSMSGYFVGNYAKGYTGAYGGVAYSLGPIIKTRGEFLNNHVYSVQGDAKGGAIWTNYNNIDFLSKNGYTSIFSGNYTESNGIKDNNAIQFGTTKLTFEMQNGGKFIINDNIRSNGIHVDQAKFYEERGCNNFTEYVSSQGYKQTPIDTLMSWFGYDSVDEYIESRGYNSEEEFLRSNGFSSLDEMAENGMV